MNFNNKILITFIALGLSLPLGNVLASADAEDFNAAFSFWQNDGWDEFNYRTSTGNLNTSGEPDGVVGPGGGGQSFDTEYMFYKYDANTNNMSIGIQTGFDIVDGHIEWNSNDYYAGDLALSFDGVNLGDTNKYSSSYEYAVDFGLWTQNADGDEVSSTATGGIQRYTGTGSDTEGKDPAGLYAVGKWDNRISSTSSSPFAMDWSPGMETALLTNEAGSEDVARTLVSGTNLSFWRTVSFNLDTIIDEGDTFTVDSHWTMSCGNDNINGQIELTRSTTTNVPEPSIVALFSIGTLSMGFMGYRRRKHII